MMLILPPAKPAIRTPINTGPKNRGHATRPAIRTDDLRARRIAISHPMRVVAEAVGATLTEISRLERGLNHDADLAQRYRHWIYHQETAA